MGNLAETNNIVIQVRFSNTAVYLLSISLDNFCLFDQRFNLEAHILTLILC